MPKSTGSTEPEAHRANRPGHRTGAEDDRVRSLTMRELGKLTADQLGHLDHAVPVTNNGLPVAWLVPLTPSERRRASLIAAGRLRPGRPPGLAGWSPLPPTEDGPTLSDLLREMRAQERT